MKVSAVLIVVLISITVCSSASGQRIKTALDTDASHVLNIARVTRKLPTKLETDGAGNSTLKVSPDKSYKAYVLCVPTESKETESCSARVFIEKIGSKEVYEVRGEDIFAEIGRPIDALKWQNVTTLSYERWMQPHFGHRYIIDVKTLKQTAAYMMADQ